MINNIDKYICARHQRTGRIFLPVRPETSLGRTIPVLAFRLFKKMLLFRFVKNIHIFRILNHIILLKKIHLTIVYIKKYLYSRFR